MELVGHSNITVTIRCEFPGRNQTRRSVAVLAPHEHRRGDLHGAKKAV